MDSKFLEHFNTLQSSPTAKSTCVCKIALTRKSTRPNINDTDTEDESDDNNTGISPANAWQDEWKSYINAIKDIPIGMGLVRWWGVCVTSCSSVSHCQCSVCHARFPSEGVIMWRPEQFCGNRAVCRRGRRSRRLPLER
jgi:hypothetical protein